MIKNSRKIELNDFSKGDTVNFIDVSSIKYRERKGFLLSKENIRNHEWFFMISPLPKNKGYYYSFNIDNDPYSYPDTLRVRTCRMVLFEKNIYFNSEEK